MPHIGNHVDAIFLPESVNTSTTLKINGGDLNVNNGQFFVDQSTTNVGIGTATPSTLLDIYGDGQRTVQLSLRQWNDNSGSQPTDGPDIRFFCSGGTIASPVEPDTGDILGKVNAFVNTGSSYDQFGGFGWTYRTQGFGLNVDRGSSFAIETKSLYETTNSAKIYISEEGNVGIRTASPFRTFQINGSYNSSTSEYGAPNQWFINSLSSASAGTNLGSIVFSRSTGSTGASAKIQATATGTANETDLYFYNRTSGGADNVNNYLNTTPTLKLYHDKTAEFASDVNLPDNAKLLLGTDDDFQIYYDGGTAHIDNNQGQIRMRAASSFLFYYEGSGGNEDYAKFLHNGAVELYHNNVKAFETTSTGIDVPLGTITGPATLNIDPAAVGDNTGTVIIKGDLQVDGTTTTINSTTLTVDDKNIVLASGAANSAAADGAGITVDGANATLIYNSTPDAWSFNKNVGIGTDNPGEKLDVRGKIRIEDDNPSPGLLIRDADANGDIGIYQFNSGDLQILNNATSRNIIFQTHNGTSVGERLRIASSGRLGVGVDNPNSNLHVKGGSDSTDNLLLTLQSNGTASNGSLSTGLRLINSASDTSIHGADIRAIRTGTSTADLTFSLYNGSTPQDERLRITSDGNVGIGTNNPGYKLQVEGDIKLAADGTIWFDNTSQSIEKIKATNSTIDLYADAEVRFFESDASVERVSIDVNNNRIYFNGDDNTYWHRPAADAHEFVNNGSPSLHISASGNVQLKTANAQLEWQAANNGNNPFIRSIGTDQEALEFNTGGSPRVRIGSGGNIGIGTDSPGEKLTVGGEANPTVRIHTTQQNDSWSSSSEYGKLQFYSNDYEYFNGGEMASISVGVANAFGTSPSIRFKTSTSRADGAVPTERMRIDSTGNVGIGTASPQTRLYVLEEGAADGILLTLDNKINAIGTEAGLTILQNSSSNVQCNLLTDRTGANAGVDFKIELSDSTGALVERLRVKESGNVGIGTDSPASTLDVYKSSDGEYFRCGSSDTGRQLVFSSSNTQFDGDTHTINAGSSVGRLILATADTDRIYIDKDGDVGIGTNSPTHLLHVRGTQNNGGILVEDSSTSTQAPAIKVIGKRSDGNTGHSFSGKLLLAKNRTDAKIQGSGSILGTVAFGGNHTNSSMSSILYAAAIHGVAENSFDASNDMPTALVFRTGSTGRSGDTNNVHIGDERLRIGSGGNVGIGTNAPNTKLDVFGTIKSSTIPYGNNQDGTYLIAGSTSWSGATSNWGAYGFQHKIKSNAGGTARITVDTINGEALCVVNDNKIGIGTNNPSSKLTIAGNSATARLELKRTNSAGGGSYGAINFTASDGHSVASIHVAGDADGDDNGGDIIFRTTSAATTNDPYTNSERLRITSAGQIGVGTSTVARGPLHIHQGTTGDTQIHMTNSETGTSSSDGFTIFQGAGNGEDCGFVNREENGRIRFLMQSGTDMLGDPVIEDQMILTHGGFLGIKTTPTRTLDVNGQAYFRSIVGIGTTGNTNYQLTVKNGASTVSGMFMDCNDWSTNASKYGINLDIDSSNRTNLTSNRTHRGISCDIRARVAQNASNTSGTRQSIYGSYTSAYVDDTDNNDGKMYYVWGSWSRGRVDGVNCANLRGAYNLAQAGDNATGQARTVDSAYGAYNLMVNDGNQTTITNAYATYSHVNQDDTGGTMSNAFGVYSRVDRDSGSGGTGYAFRGIFEGTWSNKRGLWITGSSENSVGGSFTAGSKNFRIRHPLSELSETKDLVHVSVEAPAHDLIYRGKSELVNGSTTINLDTKFGMTEGTFVALNRNIQCFTSNESDWSAVRGSVSGNILTIECQDSSSTATVSWMVIGERQDDGVKSLVTTDADGNLILEPDQEPEDIDEGKPEMPD